MHNESHMIRIYFLIGFIVLVAFAGFVGQKQEYVVVNPVVEAPAEIVPVKEEIVLPSQVEPEEIPILEIRTKGKSGIEVVPNPLIIRPGTKVELVNLDRLYRADKEERGEYQWQHRLHKFVVQPHTGIEGEHITPLLDYGESATFVFRDSGRYKGFDPIYSTTFTVLVEEDGMLATAHVVSEEAGQMSLAGVAALVMVVLFAIARIRKK